MKSQPLKWLAGAVAFGAAAALLDALFLEKYFFEVKTFNIGLPEGSGKKLKLILLTDLHFKHHLWPPYRKLARKVNALEPDLLLITGDTLDSSGNTMPMAKFFRLLDEKVQKVAIPGNNDYRADKSLQSLKEVYRQHHCDFLINESKAYTLRGERIMVTGMDDFIEGKCRLRKAVQHVGREAHHLLLVHSPLQQEPVLAETARINHERAPEEQLKFDYIFAGHNHGGQVRLPGYVPVLPNKSGDYINGWYNSSPPYLYLSKGFGTSSVPFRFDARSEVTFFNYYV
ncbi:metallophosphoesterase [Pontibacter chitinilyticus]|uniref:metallophosphoesterase n=1 Tax=Pontibacter chitinilyticus TaxID=2674989 RepID=UPI003219FED6